MSNELRTFSEAGMHDPDRRPRPVAEVITVDGVEIEPTSPLRALYDEMNTPEDVDFTPEQRLVHRRLRIEAAKVLAPFLRPKLAQVEMTGGLKLTHEEALKELE